MADVIDKEKSNRGKPTTVFADLIHRGIRAGQVPARTREAMDWYRRRAVRISDITGGKLIKEERDRWVNKVQVGGLYVWQYQAKHAKTLPYWDRFPCDFIIPSLLGNKYFNGINLHYLPPTMRALLMDRLYDTLNNNKFNETTKLKITYEYLKEMGNLWKPCYKTYLKSHVQSKFLEINVNEWDVAAWLPIADWQNATQATVWRHSRDTVRNAG